MPVGEVCQQLLPESETQYKTTGPNTSVEDLEGVGPETATVLSVCH